LDLRKGEFTRIWIREFINEGDGIRRRGDTVQSSDIGIIREFSKDPVEMEPIQDDKMEIVNAQFARSFKVPFGSYQEVINSGKREETTTTMDWSPASQLLEVRVERGGEEQVIYIPGSNIIRMSPNQKPSYVKKQQEQVGMDAGAASISGGGSTPQKAKRGRPRKAEA
jgi:hypothetical protein